MNFTDTIILVGAFVGIFSIPLIRLSQYIKAHTRNAHIKTAMDWAGQAVSYVSGTEVSSDQNKEQAIATLTARIKANGLAKNFTDEQIKFYINQAINELNKEVK
ncbi:phage holin, LLH family [Fructobacillus sp. W13]|uniref:Phage holin, LLH family n=1 Tax=Fructobacillus apis TaxID=2935017 RepID=A0ABT0ZPH9_9LACO|nr:phage holin, LLH family [Fructobacillus apis]MCO0831903.1 phage holin, LLH family [Fructobacillus apis]